MTSTSIHIVIGSSAGEEGARKERWIGLLIVLSRLPKFPLVPRARYGSQCSKARGDEPVILGFSSVLKWFLVEALYAIRAAAQEGQASRSKQASSSRGNQQT
eukprot:386218-Hanusia_phi.AAC.1